MYLGTDTPKIEEDKPVTRRNVEMKALKPHEKGKQSPSSEDVQNEAGKSLQQSSRQRITRNAELLLRCGKGKQFDLGNFQKASEKSLKQSTRERVSDGESVQEKVMQPKPSNRDEEAIELKLGATKRKLHERYEQAQNAWNKIQVVEFIDLPQMATSCAKTHKAKEHLRIQKAYVGFFKR